MSQNTRRMGENTEKLEPVKTYNMDQSLTYERPNLGPVLTLQHIYAGQPPAGPLKTFPESQFGDHKK